MSKCTREDFGLDILDDENELNRHFPYVNGNSPSFYKPVDQQVNYFETYWPKMWCPREHIRLQGNYNSEKAATFVIALKKCDP